MTVSRPGEIATPTVSVIVPVYNASRWLEATVRSILDQEYQNLEVILVDDGSADGSAEICDNFAVQDERVVVVHRANGGIGAAQNSGLDVMTGELVTFCDNDDLMSPRLVQRLVEILLGTGSDMSCCRWSNVGESAAADALRAHADDPAGVIATYANPAANYQSVFSKVLRLLRRSELRYLSEANWGKLYRSHLFHDIRFPERAYAQDVWVAMPLYLQMRRFASCSDTLYFWVQHSSSVSHSERATAYFHDIVRAHGRAFDAAMEAGITPARAYGGMMTLDLERRSIRSERERRLYESDVAFVRARVRLLSPAQRVRCWALHRLRRLETVAYRATVHRRS